MKLKFLRTSLAGMLMVIFCVINVANAGLIYTTDSGWQSFSWEGEVGTFSDQGGFDFELTGDGLLTVVDSFAFGDELEIWINGALHSRTSDVLSYDPINVSGDPDLALVSGFSQGFVLLSAGSYSVDFRLYQAALSGGPTGTPFSNGAAFFKVENTQVPEPSTIAVFALGMIGLASRRFKK